MSVIAMKITKAGPVPKSDRLRVYEATTEEETIVFVANLTNVYEVDDVVAVAQVGTVLVLDGEKIEIKPTVIRKTESFGMGLGTVDVPVGTNLDHLDHLYAFPPGTKVRTNTVLESGPVEWRFGTILSTSIAATLQYLVQHDDGSMSFHSPFELEVL